MRVNLEARAANAEHRRAKTRLRLIEAAMAVIADKGPGQASVEDFVAAAGVSRGTFYNYFPTIDELLATLNLHMSEGFDRQLTAATEGLRDPALVLAVIVHETFRIVSADPQRGWVALRITDSSAPRHAKLAERFDAIYQGAVDRGRVRPTTPDAARNLLVGAVRLAQSEILAGRADIAHTVDLVSLVLTAYGLDADEAAKVSRKALDRSASQVHYSPVM